MSPYLFPSLFAVAMSRLAHALGTHRATLPARAVMIVAQMLTGAGIDWRAQIGPGSFLEHPVGVVGGDGVVAAATWCQAPVRCLAPTASTNRTRLRKLSSPPTHTSGRVYYCCQTRT